MGLSGEYLLDDEALPGSAELGAAVPGTGIGDAEQLVE
jgi:hypothetical protein